MKVKIITKIEELPLLSTELPTFCDIESEGLYIGTRLIQFYQPNRIIQECEICGTENITNIKELKDKSLCHCNNCNKDSEVYHRLDDTIYIFDCAPLGYNQLTYNSILEQVKNFLKPLHTVWYNCSYDLGALNMVTNKVDDLFFATKTAYCQFQEFGLAVVTDKLGFSHLYASLDKKSLQKAGFKRGAYLSQAQLQYSATDVYALSLMWKDEKIQNVIENNVAYKVDIKSQLYAVIYQQNGLVVDLENRNKYLKDAISRIAELEKELPEGLNPNSYIQVRKYLDTENSDHDGLVRYALSDRPLAAKAKVIIDLKSAKKEKSYLESINYDKMYTKFNVAGAITGRFTSSGGDIPNGFNAQQIPRQFQKLFKADTETTSIVGLDYSTLELRLACTIFGEPEMYRQLLEGEDLHTSMAMMITSKEVHPDGLMGDKNAKSGMADVQYDFVSHKDRTDAKSVNFGYVFGMSAEKYVNYAFTSYGVKVTLEQATHMRNRYFEKYPMFKKYHNYVWENYSKPGFFYETALGRRVKPKLGTDGINGPVQGSGAETTKLAVHYLIKADCERLGLDSNTEWYKCNVIKYIYNVVHDAIYLRVPKEENTLWRKRLAEAMVKGWTEISKSKLFKFKDIPMPVDE